MVTVLVTVFPPLHGLSGSEVLGGHPKLRGGVKQRGVPLDLLLEKIWHQQEQRGARKSHSVHSVHSVTLGLVVQSPVTTAGARSRGLSHLQEEEVP